MAGSWLDGDLGKLVRLGSIIIFNRGQDNKVVAAKLPQLDGWLKLGAMGDRLNSNVELLQVAARSSTVSLW